MFVNCLGGQESLSSWLRNGVQRHSWLIDRLRLLDTRIIQVVQTDAASTRLFPAECGSKAVLNLDSVYVFHC